MQIAIASGKGGTGKTTVSTNLAMMLAEQSDVVLVDLDVEEPNSGLFLSGELVRAEDKFNMIPSWSGQCSLCGVCQEVCEFHAVLNVVDRILVFPELCHSCYACSELCPDDALPMVPQKMGELKHYMIGKLQFVESRLEIGQEQAVPLIAQTHSYLNEHLPDDIIRIIDSPPGTSCPVIEAIKPADFVVLVTEPTPFGLHDLKLAVETVRELQKPFGVVVNRYGLGNDDVLNYCWAEGIPILARIPNDRRIAEHYSRGQLLYKAFPKVRKQLESIMNQIQSRPAGMAR